RMSNPSFAISPPYTHGALPRRACGLPPPRYMKNRKTGEALFLVHRRRTIGIRNSGDAMAVKREGPESHAPGFFVLCSTSWPFGRHRHSMKRHRFGASRNFLSRLWDACRDSAARMVPDGECSGSSAFESMEGIAGDPCTAGLRP